jgi:hypothetical protein
LRHAQTPQDANAGDQFLARLPCTSYSDDRYLMAALDEQLRKIKPDSLDSPCGRGRRREKRPRGDSYLQRSISGETVTGHSHMLAQKPRNIDDHADLEIWYDIVSGLGR